MADYKEILSSRPGYLFISTRQRPVAETSQSYFAPPLSQSQSSSVTVRPTIADVSSKESKPDTTKHARKPENSRNPRSTAKRLFRNVIPRHLDSTVRDYSIAGSTSVQPKLWHPWAPYSAPMTLDYPLRRRSGCAVHVSSRTRTEKPIASADGIDVFIALAEPVLFLQGFNERECAAQAMLRGTLCLRISKSVKLKEVSLRFRGVANTVWPESWRVRHLPSTDVEDIVSHTWPLLSIQTQHGLVDHGAHRFFPLDGSVTSQNAFEYSDDTSSFDIKTDESPSDLGISTSSRQTQTYRTFVPGDYIYNIEQPIRSTLPETIKMDLGSVRYELEAVVVRHRAYEPRLVGWKEITLVRTPSEDSLQTIEPSIISNNWEAQLQYNITVHGSAFPLGAKVPMTITLKPLANVRWHSIKIYLMEHVHYYTKDRHMYRLESARKALLFEDLAGGPAASSDSADFEQAPAGLCTLSDKGPMITAEEVPSSHSPWNANTASHPGATKTNITLQLPECQNTTEEEDRVHCDTSYRCINVKHSIKIAINVSRPNPVDATKRRQYELAIDSPLHILSCRATAASSTLPAYSPSSASMVLTDCRCSGAPVASQQVLSAPTSETPAYDVDGLEPVTSRPPPDYN